MGASLSIREARHIMQEDQQLFDKTVAELKEKVALRLSDLLDPERGEESSHDRSEGG